jgi:hypothetical protein
VSSRRMWVVVSEKYTTVSLTVSLDGCKDPPEVLEAPLRILQTVEADMDGISFGLSRGSLGGSRRHQNPGQAVF